MRAVAARAVAPADAAVMVAPAAAVAATAVRAAGVLLHRVGAVVVGEVVMVGVGGGKGIGRAAPVVVHHAHQRSHARRCRGKH